MLRGPGVASTKRALRITELQLEHFAEASGDRNPLHLDDGFARQTPFGRRICYGALVTMAALGTLQRAALEHVQVLEVQFKQPVFPDEEYTILPGTWDRESIRIEVTGRGVLAATVTVIRDASVAPLPPAAKQSRPSYLASPSSKTFDELSRMETPVSEHYACRLDLLSALAAELQADHVPDSILVWLCAASYTVGMLIPGQDALFAGARIVRSSSPQSGKLTASVRDADDRTGLFLVDVELDQDAASAEMTLQAFLRPELEAPLRSEIAPHLTDSTELSGRNIVVVGASRGLGAALAGALATQGATVWATFAQSEVSAERLQSEFGADRIRLLQFDAADVDQSRRAFETVRVEAGSVDGIVLSAAPPPYESALHPDATRSTLRFLDQAIGLTLVPLAEGLSVLSPEGSLVVVSSEALDDPPAAWPHYVIAKAAAEEAAAYCARHTQARVLVVRAPKMWTDATNTPMGRFGAVPKEQVAVAITRWLISGEKTPGRPAFLGPSDLA
jgi:NAD(P)-dependent dehydrogenase (short-subunit alcohol dehydrogenase family)/acyl dehydratase